VADHPLRPANDRRLGGPLPRQQANRTQAPLQATCAFGPRASCGISSRFQPLSPTRRQIPTRYSPVRHCPCGPCDLHVLSMPPAFALSQDQTLRFIMPGSRKNIPENTDQTNKPCLSFRLAIPANSSNQGGATRNHPHKRNCNASRKIHHGNTHKHLNLNQYRAHSQLHPSIGDQMPRLPPTLTRRKHKGAANVSLPSNMQLSKNAGRARSAQNHGFVAGGAL
jgi:hypothetical protein